MSEDLINVALLLFMLVTAVAIVRLRNLFASVMLTGIYSLLAASVFVLLDAVDVAFTEASVGAGISLVLFLGTLALVSAKDRASRPKEILPFAIAIVTGALLLYGTLDMPLYGDPDAPIHQHVADVYIEQSGETTGVPNIVTAVLASYRGYDTLGETTVIFTAALAVMMLLGRGRRRPKIVRDGEAPGGGKAQDEDESQDEDEAGA